FSVLASSFACTFAHSRPLWRSMFFSKRPFNALSSSSRCSGDNSFLLLLMFFILLLQAHRLTGGTCRRKSGHCHRVGSDRRQSLRQRPVEKKPGSAGVRASGSRGGSERAFSAPRNQSATQPADTRASHRILLGLVA